jgi:hypothetical protein
MGMAIALHRWNLGAAMGNDERRTAFATLCLFALAFGWIEASAVVYLREIDVQAVSLHDTSYVAGFPVTLVSLPSRLVALEMAREGCTIVVLGVVAWLAGRRLADRAGAFLLSFAIWDLTYYATLKGVLDWPDSLSTWDILFLIPLPWVAPVWAPVTVATLFAVAGNHLFWTADRERRYRWRDFGVLVASVLLTIAAFLVESGAAINQREPERFPVWLFWAGVVLGMSWFARVEWRAAMSEHGRRPWVGMRERTITPESSKTTAEANWSGPVRAMAGERAEVHPGDVVTEYEKAKTRLEALVRDADDVGDRLQRLAHGLSAHPARMIIGFPDRFIENPSDWDIVPSHPLPSMEHLAVLTNEIRELSQKVEDLRERLILMGLADIAERPDRFFQ